MITTPTDAWYVAVASGHAAGDPHLIVVASSDGHPLQAGDRIPAQAGAWHPSRVPGVPA